jgi:hypothetical protein
VSRIDRGVCGDGTAERCGSRRAGRGGGAALLVAIAALTASPAMARVVEKRRPPVGERVPSVSLYDAADWNDGKQDEAAPCIRKSCPSDAFAGRSGFGRLPEPASWALMLIGAGGVGALVRRRRGLPSRV